MSDLSSGATTAMGKQSTAAFALACVAALGLLGFFYLRSRGQEAVLPDARQPRFQLSLPRGVRIPSLGSGASFLAISPHGEQVAFVGVNVGGRVLYLRDRYELDARLLPGTEGASCPFFSPDGRWLGFGAGGKLKKVALDGGAVVTIADAPQLRGASWGEDGTIVFSSGARGLLQVSTDGGEVRELTKPDPEVDYDHRWPVILPGRRAVLFVVTAKTLDHHVAVLDVATGSTAVLVKDASYPRYTATGHLIYARAGVLYGVPFDLERLQLAGAALPVFEGVAMWSSPGSGSSSGFAHYDVSGEGSLVFAARDARLPRRSLVWVDRQGRMEPINTMSRAYEQPALSPDGRQLAVRGTEADFDGTFILDMSRGAWTRVEGDMSWMPDGDRFLVGTFDPPEIQIASASGAFPRERLYDGEAQLLAVAPDGSAVLFCSQPAPAQWDIWRVPLTGNRLPEPFLTTPTLEVTPSFSPDGRWVAYRSDESGRAEIWVRPYLGPGPAHLVSNDTGFSPRWSRDGTEIFFLSRGRLMSAAVRVQGEFSSESPREIFQVPEDIEMEWNFYDVTPDGKRFVMVRKDPFELRPLELTMVPSWTWELEARMAGTTDR